MTTNGVPAQAVAPVRAVLLVEDDLALSGYLASALKDAGYTVQTAHDRAQALAAWAAPQPPMLILLDLGLPPRPSTMVEGLAVLDQGLRLAPGAKVIVLTGQDERTAALEAVRRGAFDFLVKPATMASILAALSRAELFVRQEGRLAETGEARLHLTAKLDEGPKEAAANAEEQLLRRAFVASNYNVAQTARQLGLAREHVYYYLNKYGLRRPD
ncbi:response regulator [Rhodoferax sp.]|uniref:response regulator n=1 Tax=Rhodoferax sp. TaxID=50421 RepID=UPI00276C0C32|nr:response regulator [Rhodoferax sp.]